MKEEKNTINVLIKDGNRTVNWDYPEDKTVGEILEENDFKPILSTLMVKQGLTPDGKQKRVVITMKPMPEKKPAVKKGAVDSVR